MAVSLVESSGQALAAWGAHVTTGVYPSRGHEVGADELRDAREFLSARLTKRRVSPCCGKRPNSVAVSTGAKDTLTA